MKISIIGLCVFTLTGCTQINLQPVGGPLSEEEPVPIVKGSARSLTEASGRIRFRMPDGQSCSSAWTSDSRLIRCDKETAVVLGIRADRQPTIIGIAKDNRNNILALRTRFIVQPKIVQFCMDESISYASAMASCLDEGKSEDECDRENAESASAEVTCWMRELANSRHWLLELLRFPLPPHPGSNPPY